MAKNNSKKGGKRPNSSYSATVKRLRPYMPGLGKYRRKKEFNQYEKAAITRAENIARKLVKPHTVPVSEAQARALGKRVIVGNGVRAINLEGFGRDAKITVARGGKMRVRSGRGRLTEFVRMSPLASLDEWEADILGIRDKYKGRHVTFWLWNYNGRANADWGPLGFIEKITDILGGKRYANVEEWVLGFQFQVEDREPDEEYEGEDEY